MPKDQFTADPLQALSRVENLDKTLSMCWQMLLLGSLHGREPFHYPALGTIGEDGASVRTVVLRAVDKSSRALFCHTDIRSTKVTELKSNNKVTWHFYHPRLRVQIRAAGLAHLHQKNALAREHWDKLTLRTKRTYCMLYAPGCPIPNPHRRHYWSSQWKEWVPTYEESESGFEHFAVLQSQIHTLEWFQIHPQGHLRAKFRWGGSDWKGEWLIP